MGKVMGGALMLNDFLLPIIISLFSGVVGAVLALIGNHLVSKRTTEMQMKTTVLTSYLTTRLDAYKDFLLAVNNWADKRDHPSCSNVYRAASVITLVASDETIQALSVVQEAILNFETTGIPPKQPDFGLKLLVLQKAMHRDMLTYEVPEIILESKDKNKSR